MRKLVLCLSALLILIIFFGYFIFKFLQSMPKISTTLNPVAEIRFDLNKYKDTLTFTDFTAYDLFRSAHCDNCILSKNAYMVAMDLYSDNGLYISLYKDKAPYVRILFYGGDKNKITSIIEPLVSYLNATEKFQDGFEVCLDGACK